MLKQDPISDITAPDERRSTQPSIEQNITKSIVPRFRPVDIMPSLLLRSQDWYREYGWRGS